ncbi:MAG TPA: nucleoside recognition domain-containing protein [Bacillota bacterium]|nr:nucleoside recognition domain-containing protein [Bacillota bacterium]
MINTVWFFLMGIGIFISISCGKLSTVTPTIFSSAEHSIRFCIGLAGMLGFWSGILKIAEVSGVTEMIAKLFQPFLKWLFPSIAGNRKTLGLISLTIAANLLGLGNVATPLGLKTMAQLQEINPEPDKASDEICTFLALVLGGLSIIPSTLIAVRAQAGSTEAAIILAPVFLTSLAGTMAALVFNLIAIKFLKRNTRRGAR